MADNKDKFKAMLDLDRKIHENIVKIAAYLVDSQKTFSQWEKGGKKYGSGSPFKNVDDLTFFVAKRRKLVKTYQELRDNYNSRQKTYANSEIKGALRKATDTVTIQAQKLWNSFARSVSLQGLGVLPALAIPLIYAGVAVVSIAVIAYFVNKYAEATTVDYDRSLESIEEIAKTNPKLAEKLASNLNQLQEKQTEANASSSFFGQMGSGLKWAGILVGVGVAGKFAFDAYSENQNKKQLATE